MTKVEINPQLWEELDSLTIIDDAYNAYNNPATGIKLGVLRPYEVTKDLLGAELQKLKQDQEIYLSKQKK